MDRKYLIRVTRHPLTDDELTALEQEGKLPDDFRSRSVEAHDFVNVTATDDREASARAKEITALTAKGERLTADEVMGDGSFRLLNGDSDAD